MAAQLPSPGVQVVQVFKSTSPTIITPTLVPCVVGVCKQIVDVLTSSSGSSSLNTDALISLPGFFLAADAPGTPPAYTGLDTLSLVLSINNGPNVTVTFVGVSISPASAVAQINAAFLAAGVTEALAETVGTTTFRIRTIGVGDFSSLHVMSTTSAAVATAFGIVSDYVYPGRSTYDQFKFVIPAVSLPDPRKNLDQLAIENASIKAYLALGNGTEIRELSRTSSFLRRAVLATAAIMAGSVSIAGLVYGAAATHTGTADITAGALYGGGGTLNGLTLKMNVNGAGLVTLTFSGVGNSASEAAMLAAIVATFPGLTAVQGGGGGNKLVLADIFAGTGNTIVIDASSTGLVALGLTAGTYAGTNGTVTNQTLTLSINGGANLAITFNNPLTSAQLLSQINTIISAVATASLQVATNFLLITTLLTGATASVKLVSGTAQATLGLPVAGTTVIGVSPVGAIDDGNGDALTPLLSFNGQDFTAAGAVASVSGNVNVTALGYPGAVSGKTLTLSDGTVAQTLTLGAAVADSAALALAIQNFFPGFTVDINATFLRIRSVAKGDEGVVNIIGGTLVTTAGLTVGVTRGTPFPPISGDEVWVDGVLIGKITQVAPGGAVAVLKIDKLVPINLNYGQGAYIVAKNLSGAATTTRPSSELIITLTGATSIKWDLLRDTTGLVVPTNRASVYVSYTAVRKDVTSVAKNPGLLRFDGTTGVTDQISPISVENPLALGTYFALLNAPGNQVTALGVDETAADAPFGTVAAFTRAAEYLEAFEVYGIAPLTHDETVAQVFNAHVNAMSEPEQKGERVCVFNFNKPSTRLDTLVASGLNGTSSNPLTFDTGIANLPQLLLGAGVNPVGTIPVSKGVFLDIASDTKHYSVTSIAGSVVTLKVSAFAAGDNDDAFYATTDLNDPPLPSQLIKEAFALRVRGASLTLTDGSPDRQGIAETYQSLAASYSNRRFWSVVPDECAATLDGLEQIIEGFYMCAGIVGMVGKQAPQQSMTNFPMVGYTRVIGTNDFFTEKQLNTIAAGGNWIIIQPAAGGPLLSRFALTTNMTSVETRTDSITKIVDFTAKFVRGGLKNFIGRFNITQGLLDTLSQVLQGLLSFLQDTGTLIGFTVTRIIQDETNPDTVLIEVQLDVPFPCNFIKVTLVL